MVQYIDNNIVVGHKCICLQINSIYNSLMNDEYRQYSKNGQDLIYNDFKIN